MTDSDEAAAAAGVKAAEELQRILALWAPNATNIRIKDGQPISPPNRNRRIPGRPAGRIHRLRAAHHYQTRVIPRSG